MPARVNDRNALIRNGAELVHLVEALYLRMFRLVLIFVIVGSGLSVCFDVLATNRSPRVLVLAFATLGAAFAVWGLRRAASVYCWLRYNRWHQLTPAILAVVAVAVDGSDSPSWWVALPLCWVIAIVSSTGFTLAAGVATAGAYLSGTLLAGAPLISNGDASILGAAVALPVNAILCRLATELFGLFVLRLHRVDAQLVPGQQPPLSVANLAGGPPPLSPEGAVARPPPAQGHWNLRLTARQLEAALLLRDGLRHGEIAVCMGISPRQVDRLLHHARDRTGAATSSQLVAMLIAAQLTPPVYD